MYYLIISRHCAKMQQELAPALQGRKDIRVILDRRHGEQRVGGEQIATERRRPPDMLLGDRAAEGA